MPTFLCIAKHGRSDAIKSLLDSSSLVQSKPTIGKSDAAQRETAEMWPNSPLLT